MASRRTPRSRRTFKATNPIDALITAAEAKAKAEEVVDDDEFEVDLEDSGPAFALRSRKKAPATPPRKPKKKVSKKRSSSKGKARAGAGASKKRRRASSFDDGTTRPSTAVLEDVIADAKVEEEDDKKLLARVKLSMAIIEQLPLSNPGFGTPSDSRRTVKATLPMSKGFFLELFRVWVKNPEPSQPTGFGMYLKAKQEEGAADGKAAKKDAKTLKAAFDAMPKSQRAKWEAKAEEQAAEDVKDAIARFNTHPMLKASVPFAEARKVLLYMPEKLCQRRTTFLTPTGPRVVVSKFAGTVSVVYDVKESTVILRVPCVTKVLEDTE